ncbi:MAG TPA: hypothetical protein VGS97_10020 [Actinocrinis sp.]|uniref:hypothetical protein n=1 Tax=Actinocrinis sp. TaxID=1920516 RepID=UPI002DDCDDE4|nr:hypothetical protein [Actinocrinis sp.]HEV2344416.1 hypothetical protein [Actinocrinis sp.]
MVLFYNFCVADSLRIGPGFSDPDVIKGDGGCGAFCGDCKRFEIGALRTWPGPRRKTGRRAAATDEPTAAHKAPAKFEEPNSAAPAAARPKGIAAAQ